MFVKPKYFNVNICILLQSLIFNLLKLLTFCQLIPDLQKRKSGWWLVRLPIGQFLHIQPVGCSISLIYSGNRESCAFVVNTWNWGHNYLWASCILSVSLLIFFSSCSWTTDMLAASLASLDIYPAVESAERHSDCVRKRKDWENNNNTNGESSR